jgi:hypothetical protein
MTRFAATILIGLLGIDWFGAGCVSWQTQPRRLLYNPQVAIAERLLPGDKEVFVYKESAGPDTPVPTDHTYEQEIQKLRLRDITALIRVNTVNADLVEKGTWIRTSISGSVEQLIPDNDEKQLSNALEFTFPGGSMRIKDVAVTAGSYPQFNQGERYLVSLVTRPRVALVLAYHVDASGILRPMKSNSGSEQSFYTKLFGRNVSEVFEALKASSRP